MTSQLHEGEGFGWLEKRKEQRETRLPDGEFVHSDSELARHEQNCERFLEATRELLKCDRQARLYQAETATEQAPSVIRARQQGECFIAFLPRNETLSQAIDMGFERLYFIPRAAWQGPYTALPKVIPEEWIELKGGVDTLGYEEDRYIFSQKSGLSLVGSSGVIIGIPRTANRLLQDFLLMLRDYPSRFPIFCALELFAMREDRVSIDRTITRDWLNPEQNGGLNFFHHNPCTVIWGPPGTGKSSLLCAIVEYAVDLGLRVLCSSNTNKALDSLGEKIAKRAREEGSSALKEAVAGERVTRYGQPTSARFLRNIAYAVRPDRTEDADILAAMKRDQVGLCTAYRVLGLRALLTYDVVILDEVGAMHLPWIYALGCLGRQKIVVCGDPRQLPPVFVYRQVSAVTKALFTRDIYRVNQMRLNPEEAPDKRLCILSEQHRMPDSLAQLVRLSHLYRSYQTAAPRAKPTKVQNIALSLAPLPGKSLVVLDTSATCAPKFLEKTNHVHAEVAKLLLTSYMANPDLHLGYIAPYRNQASRIRRWLKEQDLAKITAGTVHSFQGSEVPVCLWDTVESPPATAVEPSHRYTDDIRYPGDTTNLLNVAASRCTMKLIIIANVDYLRDRLSPNCYVHRILDYARSLEAIVPADLALRQMGLKLGEGTPVASNFSTQPHTLKIDDARSFAAQFRKDSISSRNKIALWLKRVELGPLYELCRYIDEVSSQGGLIAELFLPKRTDGRIKAMIREQALAKPHLIARHVCSWPYGEDTFAVFDDRLAYSAGKDSERPSLGNGEIPNFLMRVVFG